MKFALRRRRNLRSSLHRCGWLLLISGLLVGCTVAPLVLGWWEAAWPAAIGSAIAAVILFAVIVNAPLEAFPYVSLYLDRDPYSLPPAPAGFGRTLYRQSERLDALALAASLPPLSEFESPDPLATLEAPLWHSAEEALPTVEHLLARLDPALALYRHLQYLRDVLQTAAERGAKFYFLVLTLSGGTNSRVEALRHGDLSVLNVKQD